MGRSVNYLNNAEVVIYFHFESEVNEEGEYDDFESQFAWEDLTNNLICEIKSKLPSYYEEKNKWDNRETKIILSNNLCNIGISEYCGLVSLSVACKDGENYWPDNKAYHEQFSKYHANKIKNTLQKIVDDLTGSRLNKIGTFSNGESVFEKLK